MIKSLAISLISAAALGLSASAHADTLTADFTGSPLAGSTVYSFNGDTGSIANIGGGATIVLSGAGFVNGSNPDAAAPWLNGAPDGNTYVSAYGGGGAATIFFSGPETTLGLLWGSIDTDFGRNQITLFNGTTQLGTFEGSDVASALGAGFSPSSQGADGTAYVNITSSTPFTEALFLDTGANSFEFDQVSTVSAVPLPGAMPMFGAAVLGLGLLSRRRRNVAL